MRLALLLIAATAFAADVKDIRIHELEMQVAERDFALAQKAQQDAGRAYTTAQAALNAAKLEACKAAGGKVADDCTFTADAVALKPKTSVVSKP